MRLLVCGSRTWSGAAQYHRVEDEIARLAPSLVMHGLAKGADECAEAYCASPVVNIPVLGFRADWANDGKGAGPRRNARMLADGKPDQGLAFGPLWKLTEVYRAPHSPESEWRRTGTGDMVFRMLRAWLPVRWVATPDAPAVELAAMPEPPR